MRYGKYTFACTLTSDAQLPIFKGSTFRGVFGRAFKDVVCALKRRECPECLLNSQCIYVKVFEPAANPRQKKSARISAPPNPFVIEPPLTDQTEYHAGDSLEFSLILFGKANDCLPYFIYAIDRMGAIGIGRKINGKRGRFTLESVLWDNVRIYTSETKQMSAINALPEIGIHTLQTRQKVVSSIKIVFETPLRIKYNNKLKADLPFHILTRAMLRRASALLFIYGDGEPDIDFTGLIKQAETVAIKESNLNWHDWRRYSFRQKDNMFLGGLIGSITYSGDIAPFLSLIDFCEKTHVGKQTAFGLGKMACGEMTGGE